MSQKNMIAKVRDEEDQEREIRVKESIAQQRPSIPYDSLEYKFKSLEPVYGREAGDKFYNSLKTIKGKPIPLFNPDGTPKLNEVGEQLHAVDEKTNWDLMAFLTRDLRLGNLKGGDLAYCEHYLKIAGDCLRLGCIESFMTAYTYCATRLELSQSRNGFVRKQENTFRTTRENVDRQEKKGWLSKKGDE